MIGEVEFIRHKMETLTSKHFFKILLLLLLTVIRISLQDGSQHYTNTWVIHVRGGLTQAKLVASTHRSTILHQVRITRIWTMKWK